MRIYILFWEGKMKLTCDTREETLTVLESMINAMPQSNTRDLLGSVEKWVKDNTNATGDYEVARKKVEEKLLQCSKYERWGNDWREAMESLRVEKIAQAPEPENLAELTCEYNAATRTWQPVTFARYIKKSGKVLSIPVVNG
jgi:hypothetical protein